MFLWNTYLYLALFISVAFGQLSTDCGKLWLPREAVASKGWSAPIVIQWQCGSHYSGSAVDDGVGDENNAEDKKRRLKAAN
uniref:Putative secreted protein n=1 Tax=Amblyomma triste TaxID=251400 RepID=A0A023G3F3_AMBTT